MRYLVYLSKSNSFKPIAVESEYPIRRGSRIEAEVGSEKRIGFVVDETSKSPDGKVVSVLDSLMDDERVDLAVWISETYINPPGKVFDLSYPTFLDDYLVDVVVSNSPLIDFDEMELEKFIEKRTDLDHLLRNNLARIEKRFKLPRVKYDPEKLVIAPIERILRLDLDGSEMEVVSFVIKEGGVRFRDLSIFPKRIINSLLRKGALVMKIDERESIDLRDEQKNFIETLKSEENLIFSHTGSGKTETYIHLLNGKKALYLVPEASIVPQIVRRIRSRFPKMIVMTYHSYMTPARRALSWISTVRGNVDVLVGTRSALFVPFKWDLIVVDEDHDSSYYQREGVVYDAVEVARKLSKLYSIPIVFGSATPKLWNFKRALDGKMRLVKFSTNLGKLKEIVRVDLKREKRKGSFALKTLDMIDSTLRKGKKVLIFVRRRGLGRIVCQNCGYVLKCPNCDVSLVHHVSNTFRCHVCGYETPSFDTCPRCGGFLSVVGVGSEKVERELMRYFPNARIRRADRDVLSRPDHLMKLLDELTRGRIDILVGTRMIAKGIDVPNVELVVVTDMDGLLSIPDFSSTYKLFVELVQITGRVGRKERGIAIVQYHSIDEWILSYLEEGNVEGFYLKELERRKAFRYPPFVHLVQILKSSKTPDHARDMAEYVSEELSRSGEEVYGPVEHPVFKVRDRYRYQIILKSEDLSRSVSKVRSILSRIGFRGWKVFVDPPELYVL